MYLRGQIPTGWRGFFYWGIFRTENKNWVAFVALHLESFFPWKNKTKQNKKNKKKNKKQKQKQKKRSSILNIEDVM